jgi:hypothetical protein
MPADRCTIEFRQCVAEGGAPVAPPSLLIVQQRIDARFGDVGTVREIALFYEPAFYEPELAIGLQSTLLVVTLKTTGYSEVVA